MAYADFLTRNPLINNETKKTPDTNYNQNSKVWNFSKLEKGSLSVEQQSVSEIFYIITKQRPQIAYTYDIRQDTLNRKI